MVSLASIPRRLPFTHHGEGTWQLAWLSRVARRKSVNRCTSSEGGKSKMRQLFPHPVRLSSPCAQRCMGIPCHICHHPTFFFRCLLPHHSVNLCLLPPTTSPTSSLVSIQCIRCSMLLHLRRGEAKRQLNGARCEGGTLLGGLSLSYRLPLVRSSMDPNDVLYLLSPAYTTMPRR